ncbi:hypothetical protein CPLU01_08679 [Colletotrichum plurivorum]|uniref:Uncharacterized protein n=1 Tax=Colletotrichum plurivorum TaxID=2175906 RepID=A0A8H6ND49_9PEZI|nr:hypothetical protein CPLU01_08679 [Colletotrichum plurivorum]
MKGDEGEMATQTLRWLGIKTIKGSADWHLTRRGRPDSVEASLMDRWSIVIHCPGSGSGDGGREPDEHSEAPSRRIVMERGEKGREVRAIVVDP